MFRRSVSLLVLVAFTVFNFGCTFHERSKVEAGLLDTAQYEKIIKAIYADGRVVEFDDRGAVYSRMTDRVRGTTKDGQYLEIPSSELRAVIVERVDRTSSSIATGVLTAALLFIGLFAIAIATKESCPFVYSYDGENYVFDAEPLGGAICRGLARTDHSRIEHLRPVDGTYRMMMRNEVEETQMIDRMRLVVVDHEPGLLIVPDYHGGLHAIDEPVLPKTVMDESNANLGRFFTARDGIAWQSQLPSDDSWRGRDLRHHLTFEFDKPRDVTKAHLVVNAGTALWGSNMIREMLQTRGDGVDRWYDAVNRGDGELWELIEFNEREEMYLLHVEVDVDGEWAHRTTFGGSGPLITEDRVVPIDLSGVEGDKVRLRVNPPMGFWTLDYLALAYERTDVADIVTVPVREASDHAGRDIASLLVKRDDNWFQMPEMGDWAKFSFDAPPPREGRERTIFLDTYGYYEIHIDKSQPEKTALIEYMLENEGEILVYAMDEYMKLRRQYERPQE